MVVSIPKYSYGKQACKLKSWNWPTAKKKKKKEEKSDLMTFLVVMLSKSDIFICCRKYKFYESG